MGRHWIFADGLIAIHSGYRELKSDTSDRDVPIPEPLARLLAAHALRSPSEPSEMVFGDQIGGYWRVRRVWKGVVAQARIAYCRLHDLRHTFGVHASRAGVPLARLQRLLGHAHPHMTMRYMRHAPNGDFAADAVRVATSMAPAAEREMEARALLARSRLSTA